MKDNGIIGLPQSFKCKFVNIYGHTNQIMLVSYLPFQHLVEFWSLLLAWLSLQLLSNC